MHTPVKHERHIPQGHVLTAPQEYQDFIVVYDDGAHNGLLKVGKALVGSMKEAMSTVFKLTRYANSADYILRVPLDSFTIDAVLLDDGATQFQGTMKLEMLLPSGISPEVIILTATTTETLPDDRSRAARAAAGACARLLAHMERDFAAHLLEGWQAKRYRAY